MTRWYLHARAGRAVLIGDGDAPADPSDLQLPNGLAAALHEWARVAEAVRVAGNGEGEPGALVSQRGRLLAGQLANSTGAQVGYADPVAGRIEVLTPNQYREPTPWATGLTVSAATAVFAGVALLSLATSFMATGTWFVVLANLLVAAGLAPSIWLARAIPVWRWVAYGAAAGIVLTWVILLLSLLGP